MKESLPYLRSIKLKMILLGPFALSKTHANSPFVPTSKH